MIKCFLSHSSADKEMYVRKVAALLRPEAKIFDEETFEAGMGSSEEIISGLDETSLFVIFISNSALDSKWVKDELMSAKNRVDSGKIDRIYPIIIDAEVDYTDNRIPGWMKNDLNIQHIRRPTVAARKINARLREISWKTHPTLREREKIFVGRNEKTKKVEQRFDDFSKSTPTVFVASGLRSIGRKSFIRYSLKKASAVRESYEIPMVVMDSNDSIEDFILKLDDLGFSESVRASGLLNQEMSQKIQTASWLASEICNENERVLIEDHGAIIQYDGSVVDWFEDIITNICSKKKLVFCIASRFRPNAKIMHRNDSYYFEEIPELDKSERNGLLVRYAKFQKLNLSNEDLAYFSGLLTGYAEQVIYTVDTIADTSVYEAKKNSYHIQEYASDKARVIIEALKDDPNKIEFLYFLSRFDFISFEFLFDLVDEEKYYEILSEFLLSSICERLGSSGDYIRVNEVIRDFISRNQFSVDSNDKFSKKLAEHVSQFVAEYSDDNRDISDYMFSIKEALLTGADIPDRLLIPSYFLKTIKTLYEKGGGANYREAINLADRLLLNEAYLHQNIVNHVYFIKCQALARLKDGDFFGVVKKLKEPESSFLHGFFYRNVGNYEKALESYKRVLKKKPNDYRAKSELVLIYSQSEQHELAYDLAQEIYAWNNTNIRNANNLLSCIFHKDKSEIDRDLVEEIIDKLKSNPSERAQEMYFCARAKIFAKLDNDYNAAFAVIEDTVVKFPNVSYPLLTFADLSIQALDVGKLKLAIDKLDQRDLKNSQIYYSYVRYKAIYIALTGDIEKATAFARKELKGLNSAQISTFLDKLNSIYNNFTKGNGY